MNRTLPVIIFLCLLLFPGISAAGAWVNKPGESMLINSFYLMHFNEFVDSNGTHVAMPDFWKLQYKPYYEYGVSDNYSIGFSPSFEHVAGDYIHAFDSGVDNNDAFTGTDVFLKRKLYQSDRYHYVISFIPAIELPGIYKEQVTPSFGKKESFWDAVLALGFNTYSLSGPRGSNYGYVNMEAGVRSRFTDSFTGDGGGSFKAAITAGLPVTLEQTAALELDYTRSTSGYTSGPTSFLNRYGYDATQLGISDKYSFNSFDLELGYIYQFQARNTGIGNGIRLSLWHRF
jgi:hypothetical protein